MFCQLFSEQLFDHSPIRCYNELSESETSLGRSWHGQAFRQAQRILEFIRSEVATKGYPPSVREIGNGGS